MNRRSDPNTFTTVYISVGHFYYEAAAWVRGPGSVGLLREG